MLGVTDAMEEAWTAVAVRHLPAHRTPWRYNREIAADLPRQGWKIHVSATILNAGDVLAAVAEALEGENVYFKAADTLGQLRTMNFGLVHGYSQVGKFMTVYPVDQSEVVRIARKIAGATRGLHGPKIPFERRVARGSPVYARYGLLRADDPDNELRLRAPDGALVEDRRDGDPAWVEPPKGLFPARRRKAGGALATRIRTHECLSQRGKGGIYRAIDLSTGEPRHCILKEGRAWGEVEIDGNDGRSRLINEVRVLRALREIGVPVPEILDVFEEDANTYVVMEWVEGISLDRFVDPKDAQIDLDDALALSVEAAELLGRIHDAGWVWRDLKAPNLMITREGRLRPLDFEGAERAGRAVTSVWGSPGHLPPESSQPIASMGQDLFALGTLITQLFTSQIPIGEDVKTLLEGRPDAPTEVAALVDALHSQDPGARPPAVSVAAELRRVQDARGTELLEQVA